jgi:quercetin dioxygenase-like cupin family protein
MMPARSLVVVALCAATIAAAAAAGCHAAPAGRSAGSAGGGAAGRARVALAHDLPRLDGDRLRATVVEVAYGPGDSSPPHSHACPVIGYVASGTIRTRVEGEPEAVYRAGESFYEAPDGVHAVSANASDEEPARLVAYFVCDRDVPLSVPVPQDRAAGAPRGGR